MSRFSIAAIGADRPGIVAAVTGVLVERNCNIEDTAMAILGGHFSMMLVVSGPTDLDAPALESALAPVAAEMHLVTMVRAIDPAVAASPAGALWTVNVHGADHPGIVHGIARALADMHVNVVDLATRVVPGDGGPVYVMVLDVTLPDDVAPDAFESALMRTGAELGVVCKAHESEADILERVAVRAVVGLPNPVLADPTPAVEVFDEALAALVTDLLDTMRASPGCVGLAAPQIAVSQRVAVIDLRGHKKAPVNHGELVLVNPSIESHADADVAREGCMSVPDFTGDVIRASSLVLRWQDATGEVFSDTFSGFEARAVQHELDHLDGLLFLDRVAGREAIFRRRVYR